MIATVDSAEKDNDVDSDSATRGMTGGATSNEMAGKESSPEGVQLGNLTGTDNDLDYDTAVSVVKKWPVQATTNLSIRSKRTGENSQTVGTWHV